MGAVDKVVKFGSLDNQHNVIEVGVDNLVIAVNVDRLDDRTIQLRTGSTALALGLVGLTHSLWGSDDESFGFVCAGDQLYQLNTSMVPTLVGTLPSADAIEYVEVVNVVATLSSTALRFISAGAFVTFSIAPDLDGEHEFKALTSAWGGGNCLGYYNGHLLVGTDTGINFSDAYNIGQYDTRDFFLPIPFPVTNIAVVDSGIWVCGATNIVFLSGDTIGSMTYTELINTGAICVALSRRGEWKGNDRVSPLFAALCTTGVFLLGEDGGMTEVTDGNYYPAVTTTRGAIVRTINGAKQFLTSFRHVSDQHKYIEKTITVDTEEG